MRSYSGEKMEPGSLCGRSDWSDPCFLSQALVDRNKSVSSPRLNQSLLPGAQNISVVKKRGYRNSCTPSA